MRILLSIKPEYAFQIFDGAKKYEYRRAIFKRRDVQKVVVYASSPVQRVIGEFDIDSVIEATPQKLWRETRKHAGVSRKEFLEYFAGTNIGYAIRVKNCRRYNMPVIIEDCLRTSPPQSFYYLKDDVLVLEGTTPRSLV